MQEIKLNLIPNLLRLFRYLSAIILNSLTSFERSLVKGQRCIIRDSEMIHEIAKEETNAYFAELGLPYRVDEISEVPESILDLVELGI
ncbi:putative conjugative transfer protein TraA [Orientia tsutsugamushi str. Gilliam]|uniref:Putative conjugative transfer protein TraA n=1 Tax=Orientia tsutsugamushi str. Gilliam TaxID=1359184 RepID=A0A0F3M875_ORITS|nr:putative conjugative transfer protein TraA [Orientia tsutsugamushi str. Gilliam]